MLSIVKFIEFTLRKANLEEGRPCKTEHLRQSD
jgi:hypothetical protein